ncbi:hypothetical protein PQR39_35110 [Paraburkholderia sediminicola]|uniref:hypothetical protein n=1 Tax=Paraburkholderia sediminicola TaxID=458836 RepID=UPI0038BC66D6
MLLTQKLLGFLNRVFNKDPAKVLAMQFMHQYPMTWQVQDGILTTVVDNGGYGGNLTIDLSQYTFGQLVSYIAQQPGYFTPYLSQTMTPISALALLDASGSVTPNGSGGQLYAYTSVLYAYLEAAAEELELASAQIQNLPAEMSTTTADTIWLDTLGSYYKVPRNPGELDAAYGPRIIASVLRPMSNNVALEMAISVFTGNDTTVTDVVEWGGETPPFYNAADEHNGAVKYNSTAVPIYGLFDVQYGYDLINGGDITSFAQTVSNLINSLRSAGTQLRSLSLTGSALSDSLTAPTDDPQDLTLAVTYPATDSLTPPTDSTSVMQVTMAGMTDSLTPPSDTNEEILNIHYNYNYSGFRSYNSAIEHLGGTVEVDTL